MDNLLGKLKFSHLVFGPIEFSIGNWIGKSIIYANQYMIEVRRKDGTHPKKICVESDGTISYAGKKIPSYVFEHVSMKVWNMQNYFETI